MVDISNRKYYTEKYIFKDTKMLCFLWYNFYMLFHGDL